MELKLGACVDRIPPDVSPTPPPNSGAPEKAAQDTVTQQAALRALNRAAAEQKALELCRMKETGAQRLSNAMFRLLDNPKFSPDLEALPPKFWEKAVQSEIAALRAGIILRKWPVALQGDRAFQQFIANLPADLQRSLQENSDFVKCSKLASCLERLHPTPHCEDEYEEQQARLYWSSRESELNHSIRMSEQFPVGFRLYLLIHFDFFDTPRGGLGRSNLSRIELLAPLLQIEFSAANRYFLKLLLELPKGEFDQLVSLAQRFPAAMRGYAQIQMSTYDPLSAQDIQEFHTLLNLPEERLIELAHRMEVAAQCARQVGRSSPIFKWLLDFPTTGLEALASHPKEFLAIYRSPSGRAAVESAFRRQLTVDEANKLLTLSTQVLALAAEVDDGRLVQFLLELLPDALETLLEDPQQIRTLYDLERDAITTLAAMPRELRVAAWNRLPNALALADNTKLSLRWIFSFSPTIWSTLLQHQEAFLALATQSREGAERAFLRVEHPQKAEDRLVLLPALIRLSGKNTDLLLALTELDPLAQQHILAQTEAFKKLLTAGVTHDWLTAALDTIEPDHVGAALQQADQFLAAIAKTPLWHQVQLFPPTLVGRILRNPGLFAEIAGADPTGAFRRWLTTEVELNEAREILRRGEEILALAASLNLPLSDLIGIRSFNLVLVLENPEQFSSRLHTRGLLSILDQLKLRPGLLPRIWENMPGAEALGRSELLTFLQDPRTTPERLALLLEFPQQVRTLRRAGLLDDERFQTIPLEEARQVLLQTRIQPPSTRSA